MQFGSRRIEEQEPVLYFENVSLSMLTERNKPTYARGGWQNMPKVVWEDRSEVQFQMSEGVMSAVSMGILFSANVVQKTKEDTVLVNKREGPRMLTDKGRFYLEKWPVDYTKKKTFIFEYSRDVAQEKLYGKRITGVMDPFDNTIEKPCIEVYKDKNLIIPADINKEYIVDYYYEYEDESLVYTINKERFNGLFSLEGKFYSKDENEGHNYTNVLYMPKVRVVSDIGLRLGERADPAVATFDIIGLPENAGNSRIVEITRLNSDIDEEI